MEGLPHELQLTFVDENPPEEWTATDEPDYIVEEIDPPQQVEHLVEEKKPIVLDTIFDEKGDEEVETCNSPSPLSRAMGVKKQSSKPVIKKVADPLKPARINKNGKPRKKREYTEEQKEELRERLKKAREVSQKNKSKRDEERAKEQRYKELMQQKKELEMEEVEERLRKKNQPKQEKAEKVEKGMTGLTMEDLKKAQFEAIAQYDQLRKQRKQKKKQEQAVKDYKEQVTTNLKRELGWRDVAGPYADCF